jgi:hypothetical protein
MLRRLSLLLLLCASSAFAQRLSPLAQAPRWPELDGFQETMTQAEFTRLLEEVYAPGGAAKEFIAIEESSATITTTLTPPGTYTLRFAPPGQEKWPVQSWRPAASLGPAPDDQPLLGARIALDAGHLGGEWARLEERFFQLGESKPVTEGDLTLRVAKLLKPMLERLGATVSMVRDSAKPVTTKRPQTLRPVARAQLKAGGAQNPRETYRGPDDPHRAGSVQLESELLFYRTAEIHERARLVNDKLRPDLTVCLHLNAEAWGDPKHPEFVPRNHLHTLVNGCYSASELRNDDVRFEMVRKLLSRCFPEERDACAAVAKSLAEASGLEPYRYTTANAVAVAGSEYVWARNLLANRLYHTPVVFVEPYVMNSELVWERVQLGDYEGEILIGGALRKSIFREYAEAVAEGLAGYYREKRAK